MRRWHGRCRTVNRGSWRRVVLLAVGALATLCVLGGIAMADGDLPPTEASPADATPGRADETTPPSFTSAPVTPAARREKMDGALGAVADAAATTGDEAALGVAQARGLAVSGGQVRVLVETDNPDLTDAKNAIVAAGGAVEGEYADTIQALMPPSGLDALAASPDVRYVRAPAQRAPGRMPGRSP